MPNVLFVAGDISGDRHAAMVARSVSHAHPDCNIYGVGGSELAATAAHMVGDTTDCGVIGIGPALLLVRRLKRLQQAILTLLERERIDLAVLCDWGGFNGPLLRHLKSRAVPVLYYFPPASWRRGGKRGLGIVPLVTRVATPFLWSSEKLRAAGCAAEWVGHPLLEALSDLAPRELLRRQFGIAEGDTLVALLPGSRNLELKYIAPHMAGAAVRLHQTLPNLSLRFVAAVPPGAAARVRSHFESNISIVEGRALELLRACDAAVVKSGTVTLEAAVAGAPQVVVYDAPKVLHVQWALMGASLKNPFIAMPNIVLQRMAVTELLGLQCTPARIAREVQELLLDPTRRQRLHADYQLVREALGSGLPVGATVRTAQIVGEMLQETAA